MTELNSLHEALDRSRAKHIRQQKEALAGGKQKDRVINLSIDTAAELARQEEEQQQRRSNAPSGKLLTSNVNRNNNTPVFVSVPENNGGGVGPDYIEDEYSKYDPEPDADQFLINSGATIIDSRIELTDSQGRNRTIVRRNSDTQYY